MSEAPASMFTMIRRADLVAYVAHSAVGQTRKYTGEPYINHPRAVADIIRRQAADCDAHTVCLALLHDVVEDTKMTLDHMEHLFGRQMRDDLGFLVKPDVSAGTRAERLALANAKLAKAPPYVQTVKVADVFENTSTIAERDPDFARRYLREKRPRLRFLRRPMQACWKGLSSRLKPQWRGWRSNEQSATGLDQIACFRFRGDQGQT